MDTDTDDDNLLELELDLDTAWMDTTETRLDKYTSFYKKDITSITVVRVYINQDNTIIRTSSSDETLDAPNTLSFRHICALAGDDYVWKKYLYTILLDEDTITDIDTDDTSFTDLTRMIQDVIIEPTIELFHEVNTIFLLIKDPPVQSEPVEIDTMPSIIEIELGTAKPLSRKKRIKHHHTKSTGGAKTRRTHHAPVSTDCFIA